MLLNCNGCAKTVSSHSRRCPHCASDLQDLLTGVECKQRGFWVKYKNSVQSLLYKRRFFKK